MQTWDKIIVLGVCGGDPSMRYAPSGDAVTAVSVAASSSWKPKDSDEWKTTTRWYKVTSWGKRAEWVNENFKKGDGIFFEGTLQCDENGGPRIWTDKEGKSRASFEVKADVVKMTAKKSNGDKPAEHTEAPAAKQEEGEDY